MTKEVSYKEEVPVSPGQLFENQIGIEFELEWLSTSQAARFLKVSENALRIMVYRGQITTHKLGRRLRFRLQDCRALLSPKGA